MIEQLAFDVDGRTRLVARLAERKRHDIRRDGAERLLLTLVCRGLDERALPAAALLVLELDGLDHDGRETAREECATRDDPTNTDARELRYPTQESPP